MAEEIPVTRARAEFADLVNRVVYGNERIVVTRHGRPIVALVPAADLERLEGDTGGTVIRLGGGIEPATPETGSQHRPDIAARQDGP